MAGKGRRRRRRARRQPLGHVLLWHGVEITALVASALVVVLAALGRAAGRFAGVGLWANLLPFAAAALLCGLGLALLLLGWMKLRGALATAAPATPAAVAIGIAVGAIAWATRPAFYADVLSLRLAVGGTVEAERVTIAHQVFAAYRRADRRALKHMIERAQPYEAAIHEAAAAFTIDPEVLMGVAAAESAFQPRNSLDGGRGLFQITAPPADAVAAVRQRLAIAKPDPGDPRQNAWLAAATLQRYLADMGGDLFLGLLAYNIGPQNGGLRSIMAQYGARDFVTIQPYLQNLPRDYPVRVLAAALAYRLWRADADLPAYEVGDNAVRIQRIGVPGL
jgi:soluble lytic murein transglycosylase-like protein